MMTIKNEANWPFQLERKSRIRKTATGKDGMVFLTSLLFWDRLRMKIIHCGRLGRVKKKYQGWILRKSSYLFIDL